MTALSITGARTFTKKSTMIRSGAMPQVGVRFHEVMKGWVAVPQATFRDSERAWLEIRAQVTIENLDAFLADESHGGQLVGAIHFDPLGHSIPATGHVELFTNYPDTAT